MFNNHMFFNQEILNSLTEMTKQVLVFRNNLHPLTTESYQKIVSMANRVQSYVSESNYIESYNKIAQGFIQTEEDIKVFKSLMVEMGYPPYQGINIRTMRKIAQQYKDDKNSLTTVEIDEFMRLYFSPKLIKEISGEWEKIKLLKGRLPILRNIINAHNLMMFNLTIPTILPQLEGLLIDIFNVKGKVDGNIIKILLKNLLDNEEVTSNFNFDKDIYKYYNKFIIQNFAHGSVVEPHIGRNAILHGGSTKYGNFQNSLKLILLFDHLANAGNDIELEQIKIANLEVESYRNRLKSKRKRGVDSRNKK